MKNVIYKIRNVVNDKFYVGSTNNTKVRFRNHRRLLRKGKHHCKHLQAAWTKYGEDCFKFEVVEEVKDDFTLWEVENRWLMQWVGRTECYNSGRRAEAPNRGLSKENNPLTGRTRSQETNAQVSQTLKIYYAKNEHPRKGVPHTSETLAKIAANRTPPKGEAHYRYGKTVSDETKAKISATQKSRPNPMKGKKMSEQGRLNITAAAKRGEESHLYGKRPANADGLQKPIHAVLPDRTTQEFVSLSAMHKSLGISVATIIRACKSGNPIRFGAYAGWVLSYAEGHRNESPEIPEEYLSYPRSRQEAKTSGAKHYFTGVPCDRGHIALRKAKGTCVVCMKEDYKKDNDRRKSNKPG